VWLAALLIALAAAALASRRRALFLLVVESGPEEGSWFEVYGAPITLGAAHGNDLLLFEPLVSRNHAVLERRGRSIEIVDLNSENGTFVNGERVSRRVLADGDTIRLGASVELTFQT
jgi:pSer/pThr/pTyr-binding forkhead associated (FHA) protein